MRKRVRNKEFARLEIAVDCTSGLYLARGFVRCGRTECSWGYSQAFPEDGRMEMAFATFSAVHEVVAEFAGAAGLNILIRTDYRTSGKPDTQQRFVLERED